MCVAALAVASLVATIAGAGMQAYGQAKAGQAQAAQQRSQAEMARVQASNTKIQLEEQREIVNQNFVTSRNAAADARARGEQAIEAQRIKQGQLAGRQKAVMAASGVDLGTGSALDVLGDTAMLGEYDATTLKTNAENEARRFTEQGDIYTKQGESLITRGEMAKSGGDMSAVAYESAAKNSVSAGNVGAMSSLLNGAGSVSEKWYKMGQTSAFSSFG